MVSLGEQLILCMGFLRWLLTEDDRWMDRRRRLRVKVNGAGLGHSISLMLVRDVRLQQHPFTSVWHLFIVPLQQQASIPCLYGKPRAASFTIWLYMNMLVTFLFLFSSPHHYFPCLALAVHLFCYIFSHRQIQHWVDLGFWADNQQNESLDKEIIQHSIVVMVLNEF